MTHADTFFREHPSDEQLDRLRADLYDDMPELGDAVRAHLSGCPQCRGRADVWRRAASTLEGTESPGIMSALRARRRQALAGQPARQHALPRITLALAAAVAAVAIGIGVFLHFDADVDEVSVASAPSEQPDIYADLDFYLWLLRQQDDDAGSSG